MHGYILELTINWKVNSCWYLNPIWNKIFVIKCALESNKIHIHVSKLYKSKADSHKDFWKLFKPDVIFLFVLVSIELGID